MRFFKKLRILTNGLAYFMKLFHGDCWRQKAHNILNIFSYTLDSLRGFPNSKSLLYFYTYVCYSHICNHFACVGAFLPSLP